METDKMSLKLLIDTKANKVLFAEARKDFVDFLFSLLTLPVGAVIKLVTGRSMAGSIGNVYASFGDLNEPYMQPNVCKDILLNPRVSTFATNCPILTASVESTDFKKLYSCANCHLYVTYVKGTNCPRCRSSYGNGYAITKEVTYVESSASESGGEKTPNGYVQGLITYMVSDDLTVTPMSMISSITMLNKLNISQINVLEERVVEFGMKEALKLLMASFGTKTTLTAVFLGKTEISTFETSVASSE